MEIRLLILELARPDVTVTLSSEKDHIGINIVHGHQDTSCSIDLFYVERLLKILQIPNLDLTSTRPGMSSCKDLTRFTHVHNLDSLHAIVSFFDHTTNLRGTCIHKSNRLIFASSGIVVSLIIPNNVLAQFLHSIEFIHFVSSLNIPQPYSII